MKTPLRFLLLVLLALFVMRIPLSAQWVQTNGPYGGIVQSLAVSGTNLFAGAWGGGVWRRPLSETVASVEMISTDVPGHFILSQELSEPV